MIYNTMPVIIPVLATAYLLAIYVLLILAQRTAKNARYIANSLTDVVVPYVATDATSSLDEVESNSTPTISEVTSLR